MTLALSYAAIRFAAKWRIQTARSGTGTSGIADAGPVRYAASGGFPDQRRYAERTAPVERTSAGPLAARPSRFPPAEMAAYEYRSIRNPARRVAWPGPASDRPGRVYRGLCRDPAGGHDGHRHQPAAPLGRHARLDHRPPAVRVRRDLQPVHRRGRARRRLRPAGARPGGRRGAVRDRRRAGDNPERPVPCRGRRRLCLPAGGQRLAGAESRPRHCDLPLAPQAVRAG